MEFGSVDQQIAVAHGHRVQGVTYTAGSTTSATVVVQAGAGSGLLAVPADAKYFVLLAYGCQLTAGAGGLSKEVKFTQGGNPLEGGAHMANTTPTWTLPPTGIMFDISATPLTMTVTLASATTTWAIWLVGYWTR